MARGRFLSNKICLNKAVNSLSNDTSRLAFTWLISLADAEGRVNGDPAVVRSMLFPRREDVTTADMAGYIREWVEAGLVILYQAYGDEYIFFPNFEKNQAGLRKDREPASEIPEPPENAVTEWNAKHGNGAANFRQSSGNLPDNCRQSAGELPEECQQSAGELPEDCRLKLIEVKVNENVKGNKKLIGERDKKPPADPDDEFSKAVDLYTQVTGFVTFPAFTDDRIPQHLHTFIQQHGSVEAAADYLKPFYSQYIQTKNKAGRLYSRTGMGWVDWALNGSIPTPGAKPKSTLEKSLEAIDRAIHGAPGGDIFDVTPEG